MVTDGRRLPLTAFWCLGFPHYALVVIWEDAVALITCPECGGNVSDKAKMCIHCGFPLSSEKPAEIEFCPKCGKPNEVDACFCSSCGYALRDATEEGHGNSLSQSKDIMSLVSVRQEDIKPTHTNTTPVVETRVPEPVARCPRCGSTSLSASKKGFGFGKALAGAVLVGGVGLLAGGIGANKTVVTCLNCGYEFQLE